MITFWVVAVAVVLAVVLTYALTRALTPKPRPETVAEFLAPAAVIEPGPVAAEAEPEPIRDPLHPGWRSVEMVETSLMGDRKVPQWDWPSFTKAWPTVAAPKLDE